MSPALTLLPLLAVAASSPLRADEAPTRAWAQALALRQHEIKPALIGMLGARPPAEAPPGGLR